jgi:hypothetical protein
MLCVTGSVIAAAVPQVRSSMSTFRASSASSWGWLFIYALDSLFPVLTNVFQARFLVTALGSARNSGASCASLDDGDGIRALLCGGPDGAHSSDDSAVHVQISTVVVAEPAFGSVAAGDAVFEGINSTSATPPAAATEPGWWVRWLARLQHHAPYRRLLDRAVVCFFMLACDTGFQLVILFALAPMDALPWFGSSPDVAATWASLQQGTLCTFERIEVCRERGTGAAFAWYAAGFFFQHFGAACINYRLSPVFGAAAMGAMVPLNMIALWAVPTWNVFGASNPGWAIAVSTICAAVGVALQIATHARMFTS